tara:strand:- start:448 stop:636 length:189 start_codon:yes stop_codon:yes gene_type:complete
LRKIILELNKVINKKMIEICPDALIRYEIGFTTISDEEKRNIRRNIGNCASNNVIDTFLTIN